MESGAVPLNGINFPQGPITESGDPLTFEWFMWFQGLQSLLFGVINVNSSVDIFTVSPSASLSTISQKVNALAVQLALINNPSATIAKIASEVNSVKVRLAMQSQFNPGPLQKRIDAIEAWGVFV